MSDGEKIGCIIIFGLLLLALVAVANWPWS
jgi:hypothetical protein